MDEQTMKDYIEDLLQERSTLYERLAVWQKRSEHLEAEVKRLENELARHV